MTTAGTGINGEARLFIDGKLSAASSGARLVNINPATEERLGDVADGTAEDMDRAIAAARRAFDGTDWSTNHQFRKRCLDQLQVALEAEKEDIREELVAEVGTPVLATYGPQLEWPVNDALRWPASQIESYPWERDLPVTDLFGMENHRTVVKEAVGVIGAICPWNYPFEVTLGKLGPALATGNTIVIKPAPDTPWNATRLGRLIAERTDIPPGVVNIVPTSDNAIAEQLVVDPRVDMVSFTGSTAVGQHIMAKAAPTMKKLLLELGGKSAMIVLDDVDFAGVIPGASFMCLHAGQGCAMQTRLLVPRTRYAEAVEIVTEAFRGVALGDPTDPQTLAGPLISAKQRDRVLGHIEQGKAEGGRITIGGGPAKDFDRGFYVEPTVFADVDNAMTIAREEIFGPVLVVIGYEDEDDAVRVANDSPYGLSGGVFSATRERAFAVARRIRAGSLMVNGGLFYGADSPYGGYKASGVGRMNGIEGFEQHLQTKAVGYVLD